MGWYGLGIGVRGSCKATESILSIKSSCHFERIQIAENNFLSAKFVSVCIMAANILSVSMYLYFAPGPAFPTKLHVHGTKSQISLHISTV